MKAKTYTFHDMPGRSVRGVARKLSLDTLKKYGAKTAYYMDIDQENPSRGFFNRRNLEV